MHNTTNMVNKECQYTCLYNIICHEELYYRTVAVLWPNGLSEQYDPQLSPFVNFLKFFLMLRKSLYLRSKEKHTAGGRILHIPLASAMGRIFSRYLNGS